jgi:hypothetical protein
MLKVVDLPAPFGPDEREQFARRELEVDTVHRAHPAERFAQAADFQKTHEASRR